MLRFSSVNSRVLLASDRISLIGKFACRFLRFRLSGIIYCSHEHGLAQRSNINALFMDVFLTGVFLFHKINSKLQHLLNYLFDNFKCAVRSLKNVNN